MKNQVLNEIKEFAISKLRENYIYLGVAEGDNMLMLNTDDGKGMDIIIKIEVKPEE